MEDTLRKLRQSLVPIYGKGETEAIIRLIFHHLKGWNLTDMLIHQKDELSDFVKSEINDILGALMKNEPVQYILGEARFHGMDMVIKPGVLIPRRETEELVDIIIDDYKDISDLHVLDVCSGSGAIAIALARNLPFSKVFALDFSEKALDVARENVAKLKTSVTLIRDDVFVWVPSGKFDIIVSNPPYVMDKEALTMEHNVLDYEPHDAIFVRDENPLVFYSRIADIALITLKENGALYFEINPLTARDLAQLIKSKGYKDIQILKDSFGKDRFLKCRR